MRNVEVIMPEVRATLDPWKVLNTADATNEKQDSIVNTQNSLFPLGLSFSFPGLNELLIFS